MVDHRILLDTGPLVAILAPDDQYHQQAAAELAKLPRNGSLITCWPVVTEAAWLLRKVPGGLETLLRTVGRRRVCIAPLGDEACGTMAGAAAKYSSHSTQLADLALVYLAERDKIDTVFTFDRRHFSIYRLGNGKTLRVIPES